jgi:hypothetical protein
VSNDNSGDEKKSSLLSKIIPTVVITILVGGTSPWWYNEFFKKTPTPTPSPSPSTPSPSPSPTPTPSTPNSNLNISSRWFDRTLGYTYEVIQDGNEFQFKTWGAVLGDPFESSGSGTITGRTFESRYATQYQSGRQSKGQCSGTISADGMRMTLTCTDSASGTFVSAAVRQ